MSDFGLIIDEDGEEDENEDENASIKQRLSDLPKEKIKKQWTLEVVILHLNNDLLRAIMLLVVASAGGGTYLVRAMVVCKKSAGFGDDKEILKIANFTDFSLPESIEHIQHTRGLLIKCAEAGNDGARFILAKVILVSFLFKASAYQSSKY